MCEVNNKVSGIKDFLRVHITTWMNQKLKEYSIQFIKEMLPVIAGILIALFIDNWNEERKDKAYLDQVFSTIDSELNETKEDIKLNIPKQKSLIDSLEVYADNKSVKIIDILMKVDGIHLPKIRTNAWKSISSSKIDLVDYNKISALSDIEEQKEILADKSEYLGNFVYSNIYETEKSKKETLKMLLLDIISTEQTTQKRIDFFDSF